MGSAFDRTVRGPDASWQLSELLLAAAVDSLHWLVWSKTKGAKRGTGQPDPIPRPGVKPRRERIGTPASIDKIDQLLGWR